MDENKKLNFRIQKRKFSSDIIEYTEDGKIWKPYIAPLSSKKQGDLVTHKLFNFLNHVE